jgi:hypothetical protein
VLRRDPFTAENVKKGTFLMRPAGLDASDSVR